MDGLEGNNIEKDLIIMKQAEEIKELKVKLNKEQGKVAEYDARVNALQITILDTVSSLLSENKNLKAAIGILGRKRIELLKKKEGEIDDAIAYILGQVKEQSGMTHKEVFKSLEYFPDDIFAKIQDIEKNSSQLHIVKDNNESNVLPFRNTNESSGDNNPLD